MLHVVARTTVGAICVAGLIGVSADAVRYPATTFTIAQIRYGTDRWNPHPTALQSLLTEVANRTSIETGAPVALTLADPQLFDYPFLYIAGRDSQAPWRSADCRRLTDHLFGGGFLLVDPTSILFRESILSNLAQCLPSLTLQPIAKADVFLRSFYLLDGITTLRGIGQEGRLIVVVSDDDLGRAWAKDHLGQWLYPDVGSEDRSRAFQIGVNAVLAALTLDYKLDQTHVEYLLKRRRGL